MASSAARKQREYRQRRRNGLAAYRVLASDKVVLALLEAGRLSEAEAQDRRAVERELATVLNEWSARWLQIKCYG